LTVRLKLVLCEVLPAVPVMEIVEVPAGVIEPEWVLEFPPHAVSI